MHKFSSHPTFIRARATPLDSLVGKGTASIHLVKLSDRVNIKRLPSEDKGDIGPTKSFPRGTRVTALVQDEAQVEQCQALN